MKLIIDDDSEKINVKNVLHNRGIIVKDMSISFIGFVIDSFGQFWCMTPFGARFGNSAASIKELISLNPNYKFYQL